MKKLLLSGVAALALGGAMVPTAAFAEAGDILVRARIIGVLPDEEADVTVLGGSVDIDEAWVPEVDFSYFLTDNLALELIAATAEHEVQATTGPTDLGSVWLLPPTLLLQYHFPMGNGVKPYLGAGINYTIFYNVDDPAGLDVEYDDGFGWALQAGLDVDLTGNWFANFDVKKLFLSTDASINNGAITADVDIDPWIVGAGIGYRF